MNIDILHGRRSQDRHDTRDIKSRSRELEIVACTLATVMRSDGRLINVCFFVPFAWEGEAGETETGCALAGGLSKGLCYVNRKMRESPSIQVRSHLFFRVVVALDDEQNAARGLAPCGDRGGPAPAIGSVGSDGIFAIFAARTCRCCECSLLLLCLHRAHRRSERNGVHAYVVPFGDLVSRWRTP